MMPHQVPSISVAEIPADAFIVDVREDDEWAAGHAPDARHIPMSDLPARMDEIPTEGDVVVACRVGSRSAQVTAYLLAQGWDNVVNLDGGMLHWAGAGRPLAGGEHGNGPTVI